MSKHRKPGAGPDDLLDELSSLQSLLGDAARDIAPDSDDHAIPVLPPEDGEGDTANQIPLLEPVPEDHERQAMLRRAAMSRENPFLAAERASAPSARAAAKDSATARPPSPASRPSGSTAGDAPSPRPAVDEAALRALVDEVLAQWLPRIERELRNRLMDEFLTRDDWRDH